jgi:hypothetical protein
MAFNIGALAGAMQGNSNNAPRSGTQPLPGSDTSVLERLRQLAAMNQQTSLSGPAAVQMTQQAPGYSYQYRPGIGLPQGQQYGVMAQDLERTPAGASVVQQGPNGVKQVDTGRLTMQNTAAIGELANNLDQLKRYRG